MCDGRMASIPNAPRLATIAVLGLLACNSHPKSEPGSDILSWDRSQATRASVPKAAAKGDAVVFEYEIVATMQQGEVAFDLRMEATPLEIVEDGKTTTHRVPTKMEATVTKPGGYLVTGKCNDGPHYKMPSSGPDGGLVTPDPMLIGCRIKMTRGPNFTEAILVQAYADGEVAAGSKAVVTKK